MTHGDTPASEPSDLALSNDAHACATIHASDEHPHITSLVCRILLASPGQQIGHVKAHLIDTEACALDDGRLWSACQAYDAAHAPVSMLEKVDNYLANESFAAHHERFIRAGQRVVYVEEVWLEPGWRGRGLGRQALARVIAELVGSGEMAVVLLQPGPVGEAVRDAQRREIDAGEATERIARYWGRMGFEAWSESDESWLCLAVGLKDHGDLVQN